MKLTETVFRIFDLETTGFDAEVDKVVEVAYADLQYWGGDRACLWTRGIPLDLAGSFLTVEADESLIDPGVPINLEAMAIHHITDSMVQGKPDIYDAMDGMRFGRRGALGSFNFDFDGPFVRQAGAQYIPMFTFCVMRIARHLWPHLPKHSNQYIRYHFGLLMGASGISAHRAMGDVAVTVEIFKLQLRLLMAQGMETVEELQEYSEKPVFQNICRFGAKHYNQPWASVPRSYLQWMLREVKDMDRDTRWNVERLAQGG